MSTKEELVLFLGSGFSVDFGLPTTSKLQDSLLEVPAGYESTREREDFISRTIGEFWEDVFGWSGTLQSRPSLEDHFTQIDLAANSGHFMGRNYGPKKLRALRRMTIHRVFQLLNLLPKPATHIDTFIAKLTNTFQVSIITTNWDIMAERCLERQGKEFFYSHQPDSRKPSTPRIGSQISKLHGSGNWGYCDLCRNLLFANLDLGKAAVNFEWLLEKSDFDLFRGGKKIAANLNTEFGECLSCAGKVSVRVATFSYRKHLDIPCFQSIWDEARTNLQSAHRWLFVGYSLPEADIEIRHLLKTTELAHRPQARPQIDIILKGDRRVSIHLRHSAT